MTATLTPQINDRVTMHEGWAVRDLPNGDQVRARLVHDQDPMEPEFGGTGVTLIRERDSDGGCDTGDHDGLYAVLERTAWCQACRMHVITREHDELPYHPDADCSWHAWSDVVKDREEFVRRYLRAFHGMEDAFLFRHRGYSQSDWADMWVIVETPSHGCTVSREYAKGIVQEWSDWAKGDAWGAEAEYRSLADAMEAEDFDEGWSDHDALWGGIGDGGAQSVLHQVLYCHPFGDVKVDPDDLPKPYDFY